MRRLAPTVVLLAMLAVAAPAPAATGDLTFKDCIAKFVSAPCTAVPNQVLEGGRDVAVSPNGRFVYASNRGHDSIVIYGVDETSGMLRLIGHQMGVGAFPRNFDIDPTGTLLLSVGQKDGKLTIFQIDQSAGTLSKVGTPLAVGAKPTYVGVLAVPAR